jgi:hypothetical protein
VLAPVAGEAAVAVAEPGSLLLEVVVVVAEL